MDIIDFFGRIFLAGGVIWFLWIQLFGSKKTNKTNVTPDRFCDEVPR